MSKSLTWLIIVCAVCQPVGAGGHDFLKCSDCHVPERPVRGSDMALMWSDKHTADGLPAFRVYSSTSFDALGTDIGQPDGSSRMCLGCHDGSSTKAPMKETSKIGRRGDLSRSHPISFTYDSMLATRTRQEGTLHDPSTTPSGLGGTIAEDLLDENSKMQCTSCHDPHPKYDRPYYLRYEKAGSRLCFTCHNL